MIMEAITMNPDQTDPKGAILSRSFAIFDQKNIFGHILLQIFKCNPD